MEGILQNLERSVEVDFETARGTAPIYTVVACATVVHTPNLFLERLPFL
jgi:hypothetical protein